MPNQYRSGDKFRDISAIDSRLAELEQEKQQLIALREELQESKPAPPISDSFSPEQKIAIFRNLFRGRTDIFANRWQNQRGRSGYSIACDNEWVQGICNKPRIKCLDCTHRQFSELNATWQDSRLLACIRYSTTTPATCWPQISTKETGKMK